MCHHAKRYPTQFRRHTTRCTMCQAALVLARQQKGRQARGTHDAPRAAARVLQAAGYGAQRASLFERTRLVLEQHWGPFATWSRAQHEHQSVVLRAAVGMPDDRPRRSPTAATTGSHHEV